MEAACQAMLAGYLEISISLHYTHYHTWPENQQKKKRKKTQPTTGPHHKKNTDGTRIHTNRSTIYRVRVARHRNNNWQEQNNDGRKNKKERNPIPEWSYKKIHYLDGMNSSEKIKEKYDVTDEELQKSEYTTRIISTKRLHCDMIM